MTDRETRIEEFKRVTGCAMRAIAERDDLTVSFAPGQHGLFGTEARLPPPAHELPANEVANVRGEADAIALKLRHHNAVLHAREAPSGEMAGSEEHTSELQSRPHLVCRLLLEKKKK